jgi:ribosomal 50S subunit-recycling heat shock protein
MRLDKFLWCVRPCKTRSLATDECRRGHVRLNRAVSTTHLQAAGYTSFGIGHHNRV